MSVRPFISVLVVQDVQDKLEKEVGEHTAYNDACNAFNMWLRETREKLAACSDAHGDQPAIESKLEKAKVWFHLIWFHLMRK